MGTSSADTARYDRFVADLFGVMAYGELSAFERLSSDARYSPTLHDRAVLGRIAVIEFQHYELVSAKLAGMGVDVEDAMLPFQAAVDHFHERTRPADWYESLMKAYVVDTVSADFYQAVARFVDAGTRDVIQQIQSSEEATAVLRERLQRGAGGRPPARLPAGAVGPPPPGRSDHAGPARGLRTRLPWRSCSSRRSPVPRTPPHASWCGASPRKLAENHSRRMVQLGLSG